jgi:hypothetical protein
MLLERGGMLGIPTLLSHVNKGRDHVRESLVPLLMALDQRGPKCKNFMSVRLVFQGSTSRPLPLCDEANLGRAPPGCVAVPLPSSA